jgi:hypothetical protein
MEARCGSVVLDVCKASFVALLDKQDGTVAELSARRQSIMERYKAEDERLARRGGSKLSWEDLECIVFRCSGRPGEV